MCACLTHNNRTHKIMQKMYNRNYFTAASLKISLGLLFLFDFKTSDTTIIQKNIG